MKSEFYIHIDFRSQLNTGMAGLNIERYKLFSIYNQCKTVSYFPFVDSKGAHLIPIALYNPVDT